MPYYVALSWEEYLSIFTSYTHQQREEHYTRMRSFGVFLEISPSPQIFVGSPIPASYHTRASGLISCPAQAYKTPCLVEYPFFLIPSWAIRLQLAAPLPALAFSSFLIFHTGDFPFLASKMGKHLKIILLCYNSMFKCLQCGFFFFFSLSSTSAVFSRVSVLTLYVPRLLSPLKSVDPQSPNPSEEQPEFYKELMVNQPETC